MIGINSGADQMNKTSVMVRFPEFFEKLKTDFSDDQISGIQGENLLNFLNRVESVKDDSKFPDETWIPDTNFNTEEQFLCWSDAELKSNEDQGQNEDTNENDNSGSKFLQFTIGLTFFGILLK